MTYKPSSRPLLRGIGVFPVVVALLISCGGKSSTIDPGSEGGPCYVDGTCDGALECKENVCVIPAVGGDVVEESDDGLITDMGDLAEVADDAIGAGDETTSDDVVCLPEDEPACFEGSLYEFDSCGNRGDLVEACAKSCVEPECPDGECIECDFDITADETVIQDGDAVPVLTMLKLADRSVDKFEGTNRKIQWTVDQPATSRGVFMPHAMFTSPTFTIQGVGDYTFVLEVTSEAGCTGSCQQTVKVRPTEGCHVELTWNTPADPDPTDECPGCGTDMDLHVVHPFATGSVLDQNGQPYGYFHRIGDCFWNNPHPVWRDDMPNDPLYQPHLLVDNGYGSGPEVFGYTYPEADTCYRVGVHYYHDDGFGPTYPTVRVFVDGAAPIYEETLSVGMKLFSMWDVGKVCCSKKEFQEHTKAPQYTDPVVIENYGRPPIP